MREETIFEMTSPYRDSFRIRGYRFGEGAKTLAIVGAMRGDEVQQQYICAQIVNSLSFIERHGGIAKGKSILVIPSCNPFSMNVSRRFWAMDNTDINRMFPGYANGETTQRIAAAVFEALNGFEYGIQLASYYVPGDFIPHVRMLKTGYEDVETARLFGMRYVTVYPPRPFDTTLLNYNWQLWNTKAFSVYAGKTSQQAYSPPTRRDLPTSPCSSTSRPYSTSRHVMRAFCFAWSMLVVVCILASRWRTSSIPTTARYSVMSRLQKKGRFSLPITDPSFSRTPCCLWSTP